MKLRLTPPLVDWHPIMTQRCETLERVWGRMVLSHGAVHQRRVVRGKHPLGHAFLFAASADASYNYWVGELGTVCPDHAVIYDQTVCEAAHRNLGLAYDSPQIVEDLSYPVGCSTKQDDTFNMRLNSLCSGGTIPDVAPVCKGVLQGVCFRVEVGAAPLYSSRGSCRFASGVLVARAHSLAAVLLSVGPMEG